MLRSKRSLVHGKHAMQLCSSLPTWDKHFLTKQALYGGVGDQQSTHHESLTVQILDITVPSVLLFMMMGQRYRGLQNSLLVFEVPLGTCIPPITSRNLTQAGSPVTPESQHSIEP